MKTEKLIKLLTGLQIQIQAEDSMALAARKVLLAELPKLLQCENAFLCGDDIEAIHHMRVSGRRIRSAMRLMRPFYDVKKVKLLHTGIQELGKKLGSVRDYDVFLLALESYCEYSEMDMLSWGEFHGELICNRERQAKRLRDYLASGKYRRTLRAIQAYARMPTPKRKGNKATPYEVRHVLPTLLHEQLSVVRAYDSRLVKFRASSLHRLRIEIKRLRYVITQFSGVLGSSACAFLVELKRMQDELGLLNDIDTARLLVSQLQKKKANVGGEAIPEYLKFLRTREKSIYDEFMRTWRRFHTRRLQRQFSDALLVLR